MSDSSLSPPASRTTPPPPPRSSPTPKTVEDDYAPLTPIPLGVSKKKGFQSSPSLLDLSPPTTGISTGNTSIQSGNHIGNNNTNAYIQVLQSAETPTIRNISLIVAEDECEAVRATSAPGFVPQLISLPAVAAAEEGLKSGLNATSATMLLPRSNQMDGGNVRNVSVGQMDMDIMMRQQQQDAVVRKAQLRRLKSEGAQALKHSDSDEFDEFDDLDKSDDGHGSDGLADPPVLHHNQSQQQFQPTRSHLRELSFTECGVKDNENLDAIFINRKSASADAATNTSAFQALSNSEAGSIQGVPSLRLARHLHSTISSGSGSLDEAIGALKIRSKTSEGSCSFEESMNLSPKSALQWLKELEAREEQVAEAASSKFLTRRPSPPAATTAKHIPPNVFVRMKANMKRNNCIKTRLSFRPDVQPSLFLKIHEKSNLATNFAEFVEGDIIRITSSQTTQLSSFTKPMTEITITLIHSDTGRTESIEVTADDTTVSSLMELAAALLDFEVSDVTSEIALYFHGQRLGNSMNEDLSCWKEGNANRTLRQCGIVHGDVIEVVLVNGNAKKQQQKSNSVAGLDFSSLLGNNQVNHHHHDIRSNSSASVSSAGLDISSLLGSSAASNVASSNVMVREWPGMMLEDAIEANPNPNAFVKLILDPKHENLLKQLNFHMPSLANKLKECNGNLGEAAKAYREIMVKGSIAGAMKISSQLNKEGEMRKRLQENPQDEEANKYFSDKVRQQQIDQQYRKMMDEYPESMGRVLMLYIESELNGHKFQAFVDSGAQMTIMSRKFAEKVGLLELIDKRFEGYAVGVGKGKILGKVHIAELQIKEHVFPCTITVMDDGGLGNKDMDFILGLDMLKRHRCKIDLFTNSLIFTVAPGQYIEAPFLHEKDLDESKGGTLGFDVERANAEVEKTLQAASNSKESEMDLDK